MLVTLPAVTPSHPAILSCHPEPSGTRNNFANVPSFSSLLSKCSVSASISPPHLQRVHTQFTPKIIHCKKNIYYLLLQSIWARESVHNQNTKCWVLFLQWLLVPWQTFLILQTLCNFVSWSKLSFNFGMKVWSSHCAEGQRRDRQSFVLLRLSHFSFLYNFCAQTNLKCMTYFVGYWSMNVKCILFRNFHVFPWSYSYRLPVSMECMDGWNSAAAGAKN